MSNAIISGYAKLADTRIYYEIQGEGPVVALLHGNGEDLRIFDGLVPTLAARYRVLALDTRGHGKSGRGTRAFQFHTFAEDVAAVLELLRIPRAAVIGFSDGGNTAIHLALDFPERVERLVTLGANLNAKGVKSRFQTPIRLGYGMMSAIARVNRKLESKRERLELMARHPNLTPERLGDIEAPALVVAGERDMIKRAHTAQIAEAIPRARLSIIPGEDHFGIVRSPRVLEEILEFLEVE